MYPFRMSGRLVEVSRYQVAYTEEQMTETGELETVPAVRSCPTQEEAQAVAERTGGTVTELDSSPYHWLDGLEVADVPDTYAEAEGLGNGPGGLSAPGFLRGIKTGRSASGRLGLCAADGRPITNQGFDKIQHGMIK